MCREKIKEHIPPSELEAELGGENTTAFDPQLFISSTLAAFHQEFNELARKKLLFDCKDGDDDEGESS